MRQPCSLMLALAAGLIAGPALGSPAAPSPKLAKALAGRTPGKPQPCINLHAIRSSRIIDETAIIYEDTSRRWYVNQPPGGCPGLKPYRAVVSRTPTGSLCSGDIITVIDPPGPGTYGSCGLGSFIPYTRGQGR